MPLPTCFSIVAIVLDTLATCCTFFHVFAQTIVKQDAVNDLVLTEIKERMGVEWVQLLIDDHVEFVAEDTSMCQKCHLSA